MNNIYSIPVCLQRNNCRFEG